MNKKLSELSLEELWQLFPIILVPHNVLWVQWYEHERSRLVVALDDKIARISHIGSTAVADICSKNVVDILLETQPQSFDFVRNQLTSDCGYTLMNETKNRASFCKGYTPQGYEDRVFHLHLRILSDCDELYFRDYLIDNTAVATQYQVLKQSLSRQFKHNRDAYTDAKSQFVERYTQIAKQLYKNRY